MATRWAVVSGNWSDPATWNDGTLPGAEDDVRSNACIVQVDGTYTARTVSNKAESGVTAGGTFNLNNGCVLTVTSMVIGGFGTMAAITFSLNAPNAATIIGDVYGGLGSSYHAVNHTGSGLLNVIGTVKASVGNNSGYGMVVSGSGSLNVVGPVEGGLALASAVPGINITSAASVTITGNLVANLGTAVNIHASGAGSSVLITGTATGGRSSAVYMAASATVRVIGTLIPSSSFPAIYSTAGIVLVTGPMLASAISGVCAISAITWLWDSSLTGSTYLEVYTSFLVKRTLYTADTLGGTPAVADVRLNTTYGPANELTGVCAVPPAASVSYGVPVDQTTGTALLDASSIASALNASTLAADVGTLQSDVSEISARILEQAPEEGPAVVIPAPSEPTMTTAYIYCYDEHGVPEEGVIIQIRLRALGTGLDGLAFDTARIEAVSNSDGLATAEIPRGASLQFQARRGTTGSWTTFTGANTETLELPALLGHE